MLIGDISTRASIDGVCWLVLDGPSFVIGYIWHTDPKGPWSAYDLASRCVGEASSLEAATDLVEADARNRQKAR